jgi:NAD-dependent DNA ligase
MNRPIIKTKFYKPEDIEEFAWKTNDSLASLLIQIQFYRYAYYVKATPVITDREYDKIENEFITTLNELQEIIGEIKAEVDRVSSDRAEDYGSAGKLFDEWLKEIK